VEAVVKNRVLVAVLTVMALAVTLLPAASVGAAQQRLPRPVVFQPVVRDTPAAPGVAPGRPEDPLRLAELPELRTERSRTYQQSDGSLVAEVSEGRVNFPVDGGMQPIDSALVPASGGYRNAANDVEVRVPPSLAAGPVTVAHGASSVSFRLHGSGGEAATVTGATATYAGALPGVDARITAIPEGVKEDLVLAGPEATRTFAYTVTTAGLTPELRGDGSVALLDADSGEAMTVPAAYAVDAAGATTTSGDITATLTSTADGWTLTYALADGWADAPGRAWPVTVDPTVTVDAPKLDCTIHTPDQQYGTCGWRDFGVGYYPEFGLARGLVRFDVAAALPAVPLQVRNAKLRLTRYDADEHMVEAKTGPVRIDVHEVTTAWDSEVTWTERNGADQPWTPGGEFAAERIDSKPDAGVVGATDVFYVTGSVQRWVDGDAVNHGLLLKTADETASKQIWYADASHADAARRPKLVIEYTPNVGVEATTTLETFDLGGRQLQVDVASGNAMISEVDATLAGVNGFDLELTRTWNELNPLHSMGFGNKWASSLANGSGLRVYDVERHVTYRDPETGYAVAFTRRPDGTWRPARRIDADLTRLADGFWELRWQRTGVVYRYHSWGQIDSMRDRNGQTIDVQYDDHYSGAARVVDPRGHVTTITRNAEDNIVAVLDPSGREHRYTYGDDRPIGTNQLDTYTDPAGGRVTYDVRHTNASDGGREDVLVDEEGRRTYLRFYPADSRLGGGRLRQVTRVTDTAAMTGPTTTFAYDDAARTTTVTDPRGKDITYTWDRRGRVTRVVDPLGRAQTQTWDDRSNRLTATDGNGHTTTSTYDERNRLRSTTRPGTTSESVEYGDTRDAYLPTLTRDGRGGSSSFGYDATGNLTTTSGPNGQTTGFGRDPAGSGLLVSTTDPRGGQTTYGYTGADRTSMRSPLGDTTSYGYDAIGRLSATTDPRGNATGADPSAYQTTRTYDLLDRVTSETDAEGAKTVYAYDRVGNLLTVTNPLGRTTSYGYDALNRLLTVTAPDSTVTRYDYDAAGNLISRTDALHHVTRYDYDDAGQLAAVTSPASQRFTYTYDAAGNLRTATDAIGNATASAGDGVVTYGYDERNRLVAIDYTDGTAAVRYGYDADDNRTFMTDGAGRADYAYDPSSRLTSVARGTERYGYAYDPAGNVTQRTLSDGSQLTATYDADGRPTAIADSALPTTGSGIVRLNLGGAAVTTDDGFTWAACSSSGCGAHQLSGGVTAAVSSRPVTGAMAPAGDTLYRSEYYGGQSQGKAPGSIAFFLDAKVPNGRYLVRLHFAEVYWSDAQQRSFDVDIDGGAKELIDLDVFAETGGRDRALVRDFYTDVADGEVDIDFITGVENAKISAVEVIPAGLVRTVGYGYTDGMLTSTSYPNGLTEARGYGPAGRLASLQVGSAVDPDVFSRDYTYDANGNPTRVESTTPGNGSAYRYDARDRLIEECYQLDCADATDYRRYSYDAVGNRTGLERPGQTSTYSYDAADQLTGVTAGGVTTGYAHDGNGRMTAAGARTFTYDQANRTRSITDGASTTNYGYDGDGTRLSATAAAATTRFSWDVNHDLPQLTTERDGSHALQRRYTYGLDLLSMLTPTGESWYHADGLGSVEHVSDHTGALEWGYDYTAFGDTRSVTRLQAGAPDNPMRYTGQYADPTGLYHLRARQYDPALGRFTQTDPVAARLTDPYVAAYVYANNGPQRWVDPSGLRHTNWGDGECSWAYDPGVYFDFHESCTQHDRCLELGGTFEDCDYLFLEYMVNSCYARYPGGNSFSRGQCLNTAENYHAVVSNFPWRS